MWYLHDTEYRRREEKGIGVMIYINGLVVVMGPIIILNESICKEREIRNCLLFPFFGKLKN